MFVGQKAVIIFFYFLIISSIAGIRKRSWKYQQDEPATAVTKPIQILYLNIYYVKDSRSVFVLLMLIFLLFNLVKFNHILLS